MRQRFAPSLPSIEIGESCDVILSGKHREENGLNAIVHGGEGVIGVEEEDAALLCLFCALRCWGLCHVGVAYSCYSRDPHFSLIWLFVIETYLGHGFMFDNLGVYQVQCSPSRLFTKSEAFSTSSQPNVFQFPN